MNVTLADAEEVWTKKEDKRVELGRILLKGDNIVSSALRCKRQSLRRRGSRTSTDILIAFDLIQTLIQPAK